MELSFSTFGKEYNIALTGRIRTTVALGTDIIGNITRLDNAIEGFPVKLIGKREQLETVKVQMEAAKAEVERPFQQEAELAEKSARLNEVNIALNLDKRENELVDDVPDEGDEAAQPQRKEREWER